MSDPAAANPCRGERREAEPSAAFDALRELKDRGYNVLVDIHRLHRDPYRKGR